MKKNTPFIILSLFLFMMIMGAWHGHSDPYLNLMKKGYRYYRNELYRDALGYYLEGREKNGRSVVPYFNSGTAYYKLEDYTSSIQSFTEALKRTNDKGEIADIHYNLGNNYFQLGDYENAIEHYKQGLEKNPYDLNMKYNLELALKRNAEKNRRYPLPDKEEKEEGKTAIQGEEKGEDMSNRDQDKKQGSAADREEGPLEESYQQREFTRREAEQLIYSVNSDQSRIMAEIIQKRTGAVRHEKDW